MAKRPIFGLSVPWPWPYLYLHRDVRIVHLSLSSFGVSLGDFLALYCRPGWAGSRDSWTPLKDVSRAELEIFPRQIFAVARYAGFCGRQDQLPAGQAAWWHPLGVALLEDIVELPEALEYKKDVSAACWRMREEGTLKALREGYGRAKLDYREE